MPELPDLPTEILREIFNSLDLVDLRKSCRLSRRLHQIAEPFLFRVADLDGMNVDGMEIPCFLRAVLSRPQLAGYVRVLRLSCYAAREWSPESEVVSRQNASDISLFAAAGERFGLPRSPCTQGRQIIMLLHVLHNLKEFNLRAPSSPAVFDFLDTTLDIPTASLPAGLKSIRKFVGDWRSDQPGMTPKMVVALLTFPSISGVDVHLEYIPDDSEDRATFDRLSSPQYHGISSVTKLRFQDSNFSTSLLNTILQVPRALTHFTYEDNHPHNIEFERITFSQALAHLRPTLQYLCLGWIRVLGRGDTAHDGEERKTIGCLRDWPVLRTIRCPLTVLLGTPGPLTPRLVDVLPVVITELAVSRRHTGESSPQRALGQWKVEEMADKVVQLVEEMDVCGFRELKRLTVQTESNAFSGMRVQGRAMKARLEAACIASGELGLQVEVDQSIGFRRVVGSGMD